MTHIHPWNPLTRHRCLRNPGFGAQSQKLPLVPSQLLSETRPILETLNSPSAAQASTTLVSSLRLLVPLSNHMSEEVDELKSESSSAPLRVLPVNLSYSTPHLELTSLFGYCPPHCSFTPSLSVLAPSLILQLLY